MMLNNGGSFYPSPYKSAPFNRGPNNFGAGRSNMSPYYNLGFQQGQPRVQQRPIMQKNPESIQNTPTFKLYDLEANDDNEILRLIFAFVGVSFKDKRLKQDEWTKIKDNIPFENLPILRTNNQFKVFQLNAIIRYLAREFRLYGTTRHDYAIVDMIDETSRPFREKIIEQLNSSTSDEQTLRQFITDHSPKYLKQFEAFYETFNLQGPFVLGSNTSIADLILYDTISHLVKLEPKLLDNYPHLKEARRRLEKNPRILNYKHAKNTNDTTNNNNNNNDNETKTHNQKSSHSREHRTKSPVQNGSSYEHRHRSHDEQGSIHHHHRHHHQHRHHRHHSKEPTPFSQVKQSVTRMSASPSLLKKSKEPTPVPQTKQRTIRTSKSPSISKKDKEPAPLRTTDVMPPPPPVTAPPPPSKYSTEQQSPSIDN